MALPVGTLPSQIPPSEATAAETHIDEATPPHMCGGTGTPTAAVEPPAQPTAPAIAETPLAIAPAQPATPSVLPKATPAIIAPQPAPTIPSAAATPPPVQPDAAPVVAPTQPEATPAAAPATTPAVEEPLSAKSHHNAQILSQTHSGPQDRTLELAGLEALLKQHKVRNQPSPPMKIDWVTHKKEGMRLKRLMEESEEGAKFPHMKAMFAGSKEAPGIMNFEAFVLELLMAPHIDKQ